MHYFPNLSGGSFIRNWIIYNSEIKDTSESCLSIDPPQRPECKKLYRQFNKSTEEMSVINAGKEKVIHKDAMIQLGRKEIYSIFLKASKQNAD